jgi:hypothetical protein
MIQKTIFQSLLIACIAINTPLSLISIGTSQSGIQTYANKVFAQEGSAGSGCGFDWCETDNKTGINDGDFIGNIIGAVNSAITVVVGTVTNVVDTVVDTTADFVGGEATVNPTVTQESNPQSSGTASNSEPVNAAAIDSGSQSVFGASTIGMPGPINFNIDLSGICAALAALGTPCPGTSTPTTPPTPPAPTVTSTPVCGSADGIQTNSAPTTNLCAVGTTSAVEGSGPWSWNCSTTRTITETTNITTPGVFVGKWEFSENDVTDLSCPSGPGSSRAKDPGAIAYPSVPNCSGGVNPTGTSCARQGAECQISSWMGQACHIRTALYTCNGSMQNQTGTVTTTRQQVDVASCAAEKTAPTNSRPNPPTIGGTTSIKVGQSTANTITATDPDGDALYYQIYWRANTDNTVVGATAGVASGAVVQIGHQYPAPGTYTVSARAVEVYSPNKASDFTEYTIVVTAEGVNSRPNPPTIGGTTSIKVGQSTANTITATDPDGDALYYQIYWRANTDNTVVGATAGVASGAVVQIGHQYPAPGTYTVSARAVEVYSPNKASDFTEYTIVVTAEGVNSRPNPPTIGGTTSIKVGQSTANTITATDPDGDALYYQIYWRANTDNTVVGATAGVASGAVVQIGHQYPAPGTYTVSARAVEVYSPNKASDFTEYTIVVTAIEPEPEPDVACTGVNACGAPNIKNAAGVCVTQPLPAVYGRSCSSQPNICGDVNTEITNCSGTCLATQPSDDQCIPTINSFKASPRILARGKTTKISWDISGKVFRCGITYTTDTNPGPQSVMSVSTPSGEVVTGPITEKRVYKLTCYGTEATATVSPFSLTEI